MSEDQNPWKRGNRNEGPPDFESMLKSLLGFKKNNGSKDSNNSNNTNPRSNTPKNAIFTTGWIGLCLIILFCLWLLSGIYVVQPSEKAAVLRFGRYIGQENSGLHWYPRFIDQIYKVNVDQIDALTLDKEMLTKKENIVHIAFTVQYKVSNVYDYLFEVQNAENILSQSLDSSVRQVIGQNELQKILTTNRTQIATAVQAELEALMKKYQTGLYIKDVVMQPAKAPDQVKSAFDDVIKAREDRIKLQNEATGYANKILPRAKGQAKRLMDEANANKQTYILQTQGKIAQFNALLPMYTENPSIVQRSIYYDTISNILAKNTLYLVDGKDKLMLVSNTNTESHVHSISSEDHLLHKTNNNHNTDASHTTGNAQAPITNHNSSQYLRWLEANGNDKLQ